MNKLSKTIKKNLVEKLEDLEDVIAIRMRRHDERLSSDEAIQQLIEDGILPAGWQAHDGEASI